uniref:Uncharacterized protein n=1 Tax=Anguilla anguilla TaxID=7936 RepID=A0A0E9T6P0_ANGAN
MEQICRENKVMRPREGETRLVEREREKAGIRGHSTVVPPLTSS